MKKQARGKTPRARLGRLGLAAGIGLACAGAVAASEGSELVESARSVLEQWVETRRVISDEKRDWALGREMLQDRIELVRREIDSLRERIEGARSSIAEADEKRAELLEENGQLEQASSTLTGAIGRLEAGTKELLGGVPASLGEHVRPLSQKLPEDPEATAQGLGERFLNLVGVLNEIDKFNREVRVATEVRTLEDGTRAEVTVMYVGLGRAFYVGANGQLAGIGTSSDEGWVWEPADESAEAIARAIAIHEGEQAAGFVPLPVRVQ